MTRGRQFRWLFIALLLLSLGISWLYLREARYQGRTVSARLEDLDHDSSEVSDQAEAAIKALGTNALPVMLELLEARDSKFKEKLIEWADNQSWAKIKIRSAQDRQSAVKRAFDILREEAAPAVDSLISLMVLSEEDPMSVKSCLRSIGQPAVKPVLALLNHANPLVRKNAIDVLAGDIVFRFPDEDGKIGTAILSMFDDPDDTVRSAAAIAIWRVKLDPLIVIPKTIGLLGSSERALRIQAVSCLGMIGEKAAAAVPDLLLALPKGDAEERAWVIRSLAGIHSRPDLTVPALIQCLHDPDVEIRYETIQALAAFGTNAVAAVPVLLSMKTDPATVRRFSRSNPDSFFPGALDPISGLPIFPPVYWLISGERLPAPNSSSSVPVLQSTLTLGQLAKAAVKAIDPSALPDESPSSTSP